MEVTEKPCAKCKAVKPLDAFYRQSSGPHGRRTRCKECLAEQIRSDPNLRAKRNAAANQYRKTPRGKAKTAEYHKAHPEMFNKYAKTPKGIARRLEYRSKAKTKELLRAARQRGAAKAKEYHTRRRAERRQETLAERAVNLAVRAGKMPHISTKVCECSRPAKHYHHNQGYAEEHWLSVVPLCGRCHRLAHQQG